MLFCILCSLLSCGEQPKNKTEYTVGSIAYDKSIHDYFVLIGEKDVVGVAGLHGTTSISSQQTADGGWVAWTSNKYVYTKDDVGHSSIRSEAMMRFVIPMN